MDSPAIKTVSSQDIPQPKSKHTELAIKRVSSPVIKRVSSQDILRYVERVLSKCGPSPVNKPGAWARLPFPTDPRVCQALLDAFKSDTSISPPFMYWSYLMGVIEDAEDDLPGE